MNSNSTLKNLSPHFDPGNPADCCMFHILISKAAPISRPLIDYLQFQFQAGKNLCLALSKPKSMEHLYDEIIIGSLFPKRKKKIIVNHEPTKSLREIQNVNDSYKDR